MKLRLTATLLSLTLTAAPLAAQFAPAGTFGSLPANSFGGSGIPVNSVMLGGAGGVTLGLSATQRFASPALTNDGAGTFFAQPGFSIGAPVNAPNAAWNFDFFIGGANASNYTYKLYYDFNSGTNSANLGSVSFAGGAADSWNLAMSFLSLNVPGVINPPANPAFDANNQGEYTFALLQYDRAGAEVSRVAMNVDVGTIATPEPASLVLMGAGLFAVGVAARRRKRA